MSRDVLLAVVLGAHGLKGEVRVKTFTAAPDKLGAYGPLHAADGRSFTVGALRVLKDGEAAVAFKEIADRSAAEKLKGLELTVARSALPPAEGEEFYHADLVGLAAEDEQGRRIGKVAAVHNFGASDVLAIARDDGSEVPWIPGEWHQFLRVDLGAIKVRGSSTKTAFAPALRSER